MDFLNDIFDYNNDSTICGLTNELNVFYVLNLFKKSNENIIVLTSSLYEANKYYNLFQNYTEDVLLYVTDDFIMSSMKSASPELKLNRLNTLDNLDNGRHIIIVNLMAYLSYLPSIKEKDKRKVVLSVNDKISRDVLIKKIVDMGYKKESLTTSTGEFSVRGMILDIFVINEKHPIRIEFDDDEIIDIRYYDEDSQKSLNKVDKITIKYVDEIIDNNPSSIIDYVLNPFLIYIDKPQIDASYKKILEDLHEIKQKSEKNIPELFLFDSVNCTKQITLNLFKSNQNDIVYESKKIENFNSDFDLLVSQYNKWITEKKEVFFYLSSVNQIKTIKKLLPKAKIINKKINNGFIFDKYVVISEYDIENVKRNYKYKNNLYGGKKIIDYNDLKQGDYVVHISHGIGIYNGLKTLSKNGVKKDYIQISYQGNDKIYVPVERITNIYKYSDSEGTVPKINKLNSTAWLKTKTFVKQKVEDISKELISLYQKRLEQKSTIYKTYPEEEIFASEFVYELTKDQQKAINDINEDLTSSKPMDRLLCGDVGFGKTEVAMRAIFKTVLNNEQVAYLCPTTILSNQQYKVIKDRFSSWPIEIALVNRFTTASEFNRILDGIKKGTIDVIIGTHRLFNDSIEYKKLGLVIIDEEQKFGVKHKEKLKTLKNNINVLTLSATPIPRTLKMSLSGLRDLSIIETAPVNRYPVQTYVMSEDDFVIKDAIYKELSRNGQIFILFNSVEHILEKVDHLRNLIPDQEIRYAHGQMDKHTLEEIMDDFINQKFNIIVCTTIIESGIDIPNANTLIVYDADRLGLAQLYQLRGRVGRSDKVAYAYLMFNTNKMLNDIAIKRLQAIKDFTELGSGYRIAMRDLSIRGSGDIFGSSQAGFVDSVGISLYTKMLEDEIKRQKGEVVEEESLDDNTLINVDTHIDDNYVSDEDVKIEIHEMINKIDNYQRLIEVRKQIEDRFGKINQNLENYMYEEWFEKLAKKLNISKVIQTDRYVEIELPKEVTETIKGDKLLYNAISICKSFNLSYKHNCIIITLYYKNLPEHFIKYIVRLLNTI